MGHMFEKHGCAGPTLSLYNAIRSTSISDHVQRGMVSMMSGRPLIHSCVRNGRGSAHVSHMRMFPGCSTAQEYTININSTACPAHTQLPWQLLPGRCQQQVTSALTL